MAMMKKRIKKAGIMNLLIFSMPSFTPISSTAAVRTTAIRCQGMEPKSTAMASK